LTGQEKDDLARSKEREGCDVQDYTAVSSDSGEYGILPAGLVSLNLTRVMYSIRLRYAAAALRYQLDFANTVFA
jgi:hypothetical protein